MKFDQACQNRNLGGAQKLAMKDDRRRRRKPRAVLLPDTNPRRFVVTGRPRLSKLTDYPELDFAELSPNLGDGRGQAAAA